MDNQNYSQEIFGTLPEQTYQQTDTVTNAESQIVPQGSEQFPGYSENQPFAGYYSSETDNGYSAAQSAPAESSDAASVVQPQVIEQPTVQVQPIQIPIQPYIAPPIMAPTYMQDVALTTLPMAYQQPYSEQMLPAAKPMGWRAPPALVFFALLICFPVGLILLLFFTRWGVFAKIFITAFVLLCAWGIYEVLCLYSIIDMPSLLQSILK